MSDSALRDRVLETIYIALREALALSGEGAPEFSGQTRLMEDLGMTSVAMLELMLGLEDALHIQLDIEEIQPDDVASIGALADFVAGQMPVAD